MIREWSYYDGSPIRSSTLNDYVDEQHPPSWRCVMYQRHVDLEEVRAWFEGNLVKDEQYEMQVRFNSGDVAAFIRIYDRDAAATFRLVWG